MIIGGSNSLSLETVFLQSAILGSMNENGKRLCTAEGPLVVDMDGNALIDAVNLNDIHRVRALIGSGEFDVNAVKRRGPLPGTRLPDPVSV